MMAEDESPAATPDSGGQAPGGGKKNGFIAHIKKNWILYSLGLGGATLVVGLIAMHSSSSSTAASNPTGVNLTDPSVGHVDTMGGMSSDTSSSMYSLLQGLSSLESQNYNTLQTLANAPATPPATTPTTPTTPPYQHGPSPVQTIFPWLSGTNGDKSHWWTYTTKPGDTLASLNSFAKWGTLTSIGQSGNNVDQYRNNANIFQQLGITRVNQPIPVGTKVSL